jgi:hypothetical protein
MNLNGIRDCCTRNILRTRIILFMQSLKMTAKCLFIAVPCLFAILVARPATAATDFTFTISNPVVVAAPGSTVVIDGTVTYTATPTAFQSGHFIFAPGNTFSDVASIAFDPTYIAFDSGGTPVGPGSTYTGAIVDLTLSPNATPGDAVVPTGSLFSLFDPSGSVDAPFSLFVTAAPEPSSMAAFGLGGFVLFGLGIRAKRASITRS